jgi:cupin fold WbuC family metalloprotein
MTSRPRALPPPDGEIVLISQSLIEQATAESRASERRRTILPFHKSHEDALHRMFNGVQPGTYVQPHRHTRPPKPEAFVVLRGAIDFLIFDEAGQLTLVAELAAHGDVFGIDVSAGVFHTFVVRAPDTMLYEVKPGPYTATGDKDFADWAPAEGTPGVEAYVGELERRVAEFKARRAPR